VPATNGAVAFRDFHPAEDAVVVRRLRAAGAIPVGKTNNAELCMHFPTDNAVHGLTRNPWDLTRTPGGSSGGAGASVALGLTPVAIGSDGGGSIRIPPPVEWLGSSRRSVSFRGDLAFRAGER
jgi:aspartyl-tRNA(Asn)/glutamyl-tRNA(Gln) amidotransferase subunit A